MGLPNEWHHSFHAAASHVQPRTCVQLDKGSFTPEQCTDTLVRALLQSKHQQLAPGHCATVYKMLFEAGGCF